MTVFALRYFVQPVTNNYPNNIVSGMIIETTYRSR